MSTRRRKKPTAADYKRVLAMFPTGPERRTLALMMARTIIANPDALTVPEK